MHSYNLHGVLHPDDIQIYSDVFQQPFTKSHITYICRHLPTGETGTGENNGSKEADIQAAIDDLVAKLKKEQGNGV